MSLMKAIRNFSRLRQIVNILFKEGFEEIVSELNFTSHLPFEKRVGKRKKRERKDSHARRLRRAMEEAGGAFIKLGQMLSLRSDLIPQEYCDEFAKLQDQVKPFPYSQVKKIVESELGKPISKLFKVFEKEPVAAASISQVHRAQLKNGKWVAVKVQRPHMQKIFKADIDILYYIAEQAEQHLEEIRLFKPRKIVEEFEKYTRKELDFTEEAKNIEVFFKKYQYSPNFKIPRVYWDYTSAKVVTMTYIKGKKISEAKDLTQKERKRISMLVYKSFVEQVFTMHIFHADPHPGNIFICSDGKVSFLDFGIVGRISPIMAEYVEYMLVGLVKGDLDMLAEAFLGMGVLQDDVDEDMFKEDLFEAWAPYHNKSLSEINMSTFFSDSFHLARKYHIQYPGNFALLAKAVITTEGFGKQLYPGANFVTICEPMVEKIMRQKNNPKQLLKDAKKSAFRFRSTLRKLPQDLRSLMYVIKKGANVRVQVDHKDLHEFTLELDRSSNRVTLGLIIGGLVIATGLLTLANVGPSYFGLPLLAWISIGIAALLSIGLFISILRENKGGDH